MSASLVQGCHGFTGGTTATATFGSNVTAWNFIVVGFNIDPANSLTSITDSLGNTYHAAIGPTDSSGNSRCYIYYAFNITGGANTITVIRGSTAGFATISASEFSGMQTGDSLDKTAGVGQASTTAYDSGNTATTTQSDELLIGFLCTDQTTPLTFTAGASYTLDTQSLEATSGSHTQQLEYQVVAATGAYKATGTVSAAIVGVAQIATFKISAVATAAFWHAPTRNGP